MAVDRKLKVLQIVQEDEILVYIEATSFTPARMIVNVAVQQQCGVLWIYACSSIFLLDV